MSFTAIASIAGPLISGFMGSRSAKKAAKSQERANQQSLALQKEIYDQTRSDVAPYSNLGQSASDRLGFLLGISGGANPAITQAQNSLNSAQSEYDAALSSQTTGSRGPTTWIPPNYQHDSDAEGYWAPPADRWNPQGGGATDTSTIDGARTRLNAARNALAQAQGQPWDTPQGYGSLMDKFNFTQDDPSYQWRLSEGQKAVQNSGAARGMQLSGSQLKDLTRWGQGAASQEYQSAWNRDAGYKNRQYNYLTGTANRGLSATGVNANAGANYARGGGQAYSGIGNAQSAGQVASGNALQSGVNQSYNAYQDIQAQNRLNSILRANTQPGYTAPSGWNRSPF